MERREPTASDHDGAFLAMARVEIEECLERELADDIRVEDKERMPVMQDVTSQCEGASCQKAAVRAYHSRIQGTNEPQHEETDQSQEAPFRETC